MTGMKVKLQLVSPNSIEDTAIEGAGRDPDDIPQEEVSSAEHLALTDKPDLRNHMSECFPSLLLIYHTFHYISTLWAQLKYTLAALKPIWKCDF